MIDLLIGNPLLLLFVVAACGYPLGKISFGGVRLGVAAVLFVGLGFGALDPAMRLPDVFYQLGLILFVYTIGLSSGRLFFSSLRRTGIRDNTFVIVLLGIAALMVYGVAKLGSMSNALGAGMYAGSLTNTPALASIMESLSASNASDDVLNQAVVAYSITYPMGIIGMMIAIIMFQKITGIDYRYVPSKGEGSLPSQQLENVTIRITQSVAIGRSINHLNQHYHWGVVFGRIWRDGTVKLATGPTILQANDLLTIVGTPEEIQQVTTLLGEATDQRLELDRQELDYRRMFVSNPKIVGHRLKELNLPQHFGAIVTRLRRGDLEMLVDGDTIIELGDRIRVIARREHMSAIAEYFGDSYKALGEIDILSFNLGLALGILVGMIPLPFPGETSLTLGFAGGPLVVALILGALTRTGPFVWHLPYNANLTLRQMGLVLFLAGIGTRAGYSFVSTLTEGGTGLIFLGGALVSWSMAMLFLWIGWKLFRISGGLLIGLLAGFQTQPALLGFALEQTGNELPNIGYARIFPFSLILKIVFAQIVLSLLS